MKTIVSACPIDSGKVIEGASHSITMKGYVPQLDLRDAIGLTVVQAMDKARAMGWHMGAPNMFIRVEIKELHE